MLSEQSIVVICGCIVTVATLYFQNKNNVKLLKDTADENARNSKARSENLREAVDGTVTKLIDGVRAEGVLQVQVAELKSTAAGREEGEAKATLAALQHDQRVVALALPPNDAKIINGGKEQPCKDKP